MRAKYTVAAILTAFLLAPPGIASADPGGGSSMPHWNNGSSSGSASGSAAANYLVCMAAWNINRLIFPTAQIPPCQFPQG